jgi:hypothetical protein
MSRAITCPKCGSLDAVEEDDCEKHCPVCGWTDGDNPEEKQAAGDYDSPAPASGHSEPPSS